MMTTSLDRKGLAINVFKYIKSIGYTPVNISFTDNYGMDKCNCVHFCIRELPKWQFAMWIGWYEKEQKGDRDRLVLQLFTQHEDYIDKFKPSRSYYKIDFTYEDIFAQPKEYRYVEIKWLLDHIKHNKAVAYVHNAICWGPDDYCPENYYRKFIELKFSNYKRKLNNMWKDIRPLYNKVKIPLMKQYSIIDRVEIIDNNTADSECSPRWDMNIYFNKIYDNDDRQQEAETELLYKFFKKNLYMYDNIYIQCYNEACNLKHYTYDLYDKETGKRVD